MEKIKVLLVDNQILFVESLRAALQAQAKEIIIVGVASNGQTALDRAAATHPDVILMDIMMPGLSGVECTRIIKSKIPEIRILMLTTLEDDEFILESLLHGANGYLLKDVQPKELITAIHAVYEGRILLASKVANKLVEKLLHSPEKKQESSHKQSNSPDWLQFLTSREKEILVLIAQGNDNKKIAKQLYISEQTVKNYVSAIYSKLGLRDRMFISKIVHESGL